MIREQKIQLLKQTSWQRNKTSLAQGALLIENLAQQYDTYTSCFVC